MKGSIRVARERDRSGMCEEARQPSVYLPFDTFERGYDLANRWNSGSTYLILGRALKATAYPRASSELSISRSGCQVPIVRCPRRIRPRPLVAKSLLTLSLSPPNPFKKTPVHFRIFRTVLPTAANETRQRDTRATWNPIRFEIGHESTCRFAQTTCDSLLQFCEIIYDTYEIESSRSVRRISNSRRDNDRP